MYRILIILVLALPSHLFSPIPNGEKNEQEVSNEVKELESLHSGHQKVNLTDANHPTTATIDKEESKHSESEEDRHPNSRSAIFRHRGITEAKKSRYWNEKPQRPGEGKYAGIQYSPSDLAAYVFSTGDEEGVAIAVEELVREGMMGRTDAINYLQDVKLNLEYLRNQYEKQKQLEELKESIYSKTQMHQMLPNYPRDKFLSPMDLDKREQPKTVESPSIPATNPTTRVITTSTALPKEEIRVSSSSPKPEESIVLSSSQDDSSKEETSKEDVFKKRVPSKSTNAFTLEVIYKLAKDMFTQSILRDDPTAEETLSGLINFLEIEVGNNRISSEMKEKVLEVVTAALVDSLRDYQGYLSEKQSMVLDDASLYPHLSDSNGSPKVSVSHNHRNLSIQGHDNLLKLASKSNRPSSS